MLTEPEPVTAAPAGPSAHRTSVLDAAAAVAPEVWLVATLTLVAALLRFGTLTSQSLWIDEATTVHEVGLSFGGMLHAVAHNESTPPLYFSLAWVWTRIFGSGVLAIRSLSALAGVATVPVAYACGRELVGRRAGVLTALFVTVSPFMIWYSQEARAYMLFGLLGALAFLYAARGGRTRSTRDLTLWALMSGLTILTHFFAIFLVAPLAVWLLFRVHDRRVVGVVAAVAAVQAAVVPLALNDTSHPLLSWLSDFTLGTRIQQIPTDFAVSQLFKSGALAWGLPGAAALLALVVALLWLGGTHHQRAGAALAGGVAAAILLIPLALAALGRDYVFSRNFMPAWVPLAIVVASACSVRRRHLAVAGAALCAFVCAGSLWALVTVDSSAAYRRPDWRGVAAFLGHPQEPREIVADDGNAAEEPLAIYLGLPFSYTGAPSTSGVVRIREIDVVAATGDLARQSLPSGVHLRSQETVDQSTVTRFVLSPEWRGVPEALAARAQALLAEPQGSRPAILVQTGRQ